MQYFYIEEQTPLNEDEKLDLIPNIITQNDLNNFEQANIIEARKWIMNNITLTKHDIFSEKFALLLHKKMYQHVWKWAGKYRKTNKNIGVEYYQIPIEFYKLIDDAKYWHVNKIYKYEDLAIIFHHRIVKIHLFLNGNGRHARLYADIIAKKYSNIKLSWGGENYNLTNPSIIRKEYIKSLQNADKGDYDRLINFAKS